MMSISLLPMTTGQQWSKVIGDNIPLFLAFSLWPEATRLQKYTTDEEKQPNVINSVNKIDKGHTAVDSLPGNAMDLDYDLHINQPANVCFSLFCLLISKKHQTHIGASWFQKRDALLCSRQEDNQAGFLWRFLIERPAAVTSRDAILPHFGSVVWVWNGGENFSWELFWSLRENFVTFTCLFPGVIKCFFQVTLGFESNEDRAIVFFVLVYPGIFFSSLHTCASMNRWHRRRDAINKPYSGVCCTG